MIKFIDEEGNEYDTPLGEDLAEVIARSLKGKARFDVHDVRTISAPAKPKTERKPRAPKSDAAADETAVFDCLKKPMSKKDIVELLEIPEPRVAKALASLRKADKVKSEGSKRNMVWAKA